MRGIAACRAPMPSSGPDAARFGAGVAQLLKAGETCGVTKTAGVCREVLKVYDALWTFVRVEGVEPPSNTAERAIRPGVLWRKGALGPRVPTGRGLSKP